MGFFFQPNLKFTLIMQQQEGRDPSSTGWVTCTSHADPSPTVLPLTTGLAWKHCPHLTEEKRFTFSFSGFIHAVVVDRNVWLAFLVCLLSVEFRREEIDQHFNVHSKRAACFMPVIKLLSLLDSPGCSCLYPVIWQYMIVLKQHVARVKTTNSYMITTKLNWNPTFSL